MDFTEQSADAPLYVQVEEAAAVGGWADMRAALESVGHLLGLVPDVCFFAKDVAGRVVAANGAFLRRLGCRTVEELRVKGDAEPMPSEMGRGYLEDDEEVLRLGGGLVTRAEIWLDEQRLPDWFLTSKYPVKDGKGKVVGLIGLIQPLKDGTDSLVKCPRVNAAIQQIRQQFSSALTISDVAQGAGLSERQFRRLFQASLGMAPQEFLLRTRLQHACRQLLRTDLSITEIAHESGFFDHSSFTKTFRQRMGGTPANFRQTRRNKY